RRVLTFNGVENVTIHNAKEMALASLPGPFDLVYGFYTVGYHWSLEHFLDDILALVGRSGTAIFTVTDDFTPFPLLASLPHTVVRKRRFDGWTEKLLILGPVHS